MMDYTYNGVPIAKCSTEDIVKCLRDGVSINDAGPFSVREAERAVKRRLELELDIRKWGLRG